MKQSIVINWMSEPANLWRTVFAYTILSGLFVQFVLLPYMIPSWHAGDGLLKGLDGKQFNKIALQLSENILDRGWSQWEPRPDGQFVSGVAAIFYVIIFPKPWSVLPLNAFLNAFACVCLYFILQILIGNRQKALIASLPFLFLPSNLLWNTQLHNENYAVPGVIFILYGWTLIATADENHKTVKPNEIALILTSIAFGTLLLGLVRTYILAGVTFLYMIAGVMLAIHWIMKRIKIQDFISRLAVVAVAIAMMMAMIASMQAGDDLIKVPKANTSQDAVRKKNWVDAAWLPKSVNRQLQGLAKYRNRFVRSWNEAGSSIDLNITFQSPTDMIAYIPRALQISLLSPFPNMWFSEGKKVTGDGMRVASAIEMAFAYLCLSGLPVFMWRNRTKPAAWVIVFVCLSMLIVYAMIIPNIGSLYRFRYPYFMPLICLGFATWVEKYQGRHSRN